MANVFDPLVFQPNVFQVGTPDVVIPDVPTKRRKWLSISVPGSGRAGGVSAFAVSRDSAGILIGVRDKAAPQFAVSRDAEGILLSAWPVVSSFHSLHLPAAYTGMVFAPQDAAVGETAGNSLFMGAGHFEFWLYAFDGLMKFETSTLPAKDLGAEPTAARLWLKRNGLSANVPDMEIRLGTTFPDPPTVDDWKTTAEYLALTLLGTVYMNNSVRTASTDFAASHLNMDGDTYFYLSWVGRDGDPADWTGYADSVFSAAADLYLEVDYGTP